MDYTPRKSIPPKSFYTLFTINSINFIITVLMFIFQVEWPIFFYFLTLWTYILNTIYLISIWIADINLFFFKSFSFEKFAFVLREKIGPVLNGLSHMVVLSFWTLLAMGPQYMQMETDAISILSNLHLHGALSVIAIVDVMFSKHLKKGFDWKLVLFLLVLYSMYALLVIISKYTGGLIPYPFLIDVSVGMLLVYLVILYGVLVLGYVLHLGIIQMKYKFCMNEDDVITVSPIVENLIVQENEDNKEEHN